MIQLSNVTLKRGATTLFTGLDLTVHAGHRAGVVGRNGVGKTSLFLLLRGRLLPEEGDVRVPRSWTIAHLAQETEASRSTALDWTMDGDRPLRAVERAIEAAEREGDDRRLAALYAELEAIDGYTAEARAGRILDGLGFDPEDFARPVADFSGGWRIRLNLAQTLMCRSDLLLLDEPTNHLDLDAVMWLEQWLARREGTSLLISHDRDFLDRAATDIVHLENGRARAYRGGYSSFERQRSERLATERATFEKQRRRAREIQAFVTRFGAKASKARQARSRVKELERLALAAPAHADSSYRFSFPDPDKVSNPLLLIEDAGFGYGGEPVLAGVRLTLQPGARLGLLGRNGAGKTTLMRGIAGELPVAEGHLERGRNASVGYFAQHTMESLVPAKSPLQHLAAADPEATDQAMRTTSAAGASPATRRSRAPRSSRGARRPGSPSPSSRGESPPCCSSTSRRTISTSTCAMPSRWLSSPTGVPSWWCPMTVTSSGTPWTSCCSSRMAGWRPTTGPWTSTGAGSSAAMTPRLRRGRAVRRETRRPSGAAPGRRRGRGSSPSATSFARSRPPSRRSSRSSTRSTPSSRTPTPTAG